MKTIRMLTDAVGGNGEALEADKTYQLEDASAQHWLKRNKAMEIEQDDSSIELLDETPNDPRPSDGMTVAQIKEALDAGGIEIPDGVTLKADLAALLDNA